MDPQANSTMIGPTVINYLGLNDLLKPKLWNATKLSVFIPYED